MTNNDVVVAVSLRVDGIFVGRRLGPLVGLGVMDTTGTVVGGLVGLGVNIGDFTGVAVGTIIGV